MTYDHEAGEFSLTPEESSRYDFWTEDFQLITNPRNRALRAWKSPSYREGVIMGRRVVNAYNSLINKEARDEEFYSNLREGYNDYVQTQGDLPSNQFPIYHLGASVALKSNTYPIDSKERQDFRDGFFDKAIVDQDLEEEDQQMEV